jgi:CheY-like chemotaxis protein
MSSKIRKLRVLVIEDESLVAMLIEDILNDLGHEVAAIASRMPDALDIARSGQVDLAIIDVNLDGQPGYPVADILAERGVPFLFATGYGVKGIDPKYSDTPVLTKPFAAAELESMLSQISKNL